MPASKYVVVLKTLPACPVCSRYMALSRFHPAIVASPTRMTSLPNCGLCPTGSSICLMEMVFVGTSTVTLYIPSSVILHLLSSPPKTILFWSLPSRKIYTLLSYPHCLLVVNLNSPSFNSTVAV